MIAPRLHRNTTRASAAPCSFSVEVESTEARTGIPREGVATAKARSHGFSVAPTRLQDFSLGRKLRSGHKLDFHKVYGLSAKQNIQ